VPLLLVEGFADWAALKPVGFSVAVDPAALDQRGRQGRFDGLLPGDSEFRGRTRRSPTTRGSAFCLWVADTFGAGKLRALYREFRGPDPPSTSRLDRGFRTSSALSRKTPSDAGPPGSATSSAV
jgi:hypothetical protein